MTILVFIIKFLFNQKSLNVRVILSLSFFNKMQRIVIADALKEQNENMKILREQCEKEIETDPESFNDDLFLLRFALSHKDNIKEKGVPALKETIAWRNANKDLLAKLRTGEKHPCEVKMVKYSPFALHGQSKGGDPIAVTRTGIANTTILQMKMTADEIKQGIIFQKEYCAHICDQESRKRGYICKLISIVDMKGFGLSSIDRTFTKSMGEAMSSTESHYPQLLGSMFLLNTPFFMSAVLALAEFFLPARTFAKLARCKGTTRKEPWDTCPFAKMWFDRSSLPTFIGGTCTCNGTNKCIAGTDNDVKEMIYPDNIDPDDEKDKKEEDVKK